VRWLLWNPEVHTQFPVALQDIMWAVFMSRHQRAAASFLHYLDDEQLFYIMNMVEWWDMEPVKEELKAHEPKVSTDLLRPASPKRG
jgi:hypothetical protein